MKAFLWQGILYFINIWTCLFPDVFVRSLISNFVVQWIWMTECIILATVLSAVGWLRTWSVHIVVAASVTGSVPGGSLWLSSVSGRSFLEMNLPVFIHLAVPFRQTNVSVSWVKTLHSRTQTLPFLWALSPFERTNVHGHSFTFFSDTVSLLSFVRSFLPAPFRC